jgi:polysaccharide biosynthesis/export protein
MRRTAAAADSFMNHFGVLVAMLAAALLGGCASQNLTVSAPRASVEAPYRLGSGDRVRIIVFGQDNLSNSFSVDGAGDI